MLRFSVWKVSNTIMLKVVPSVPIHCSAQAIYSEYPEFQSRVALARQCWRDRLNSIDDEYQSVLSDPGYSSDQIKDKIGQFNLAREEAHKRLDAEIDLAHQQLNVPYLVDCITALLTTGMAVYHNDTPLMPGVVSDIIQASVALVDKDAEGNTDLVQVHYAHSVVIKRSDFIRWGIDDTMGVLNSATWEAVTGPDYWLNCLNNNNNAGLGPRCVHQKTQCWIRCNVDGSWDMINGQCLRFEGRDETEVNDQLRKWDVPLVGWE